MSKKLKINNKFCKCKEKINGHWAHLFIRKRDAVARTNKSGKLIIINNLHKQTKNSLRKLKVLRIKEFRTDLLTKQGKAWQELPHQLDKETVKHSNIRLTPYAFSFLSLIIIYHVLMYFSICINNYYYYKRVYGGMF